MTSSIRSPRSDSRTETRARRPSTQVVVEWREPDRTLVDYLAAVWSRKIWIAIAAAAGTAVATVYALTRPNVYASQASVLVLGNRSGTSAAEVAANILRVGNVGPSQVLSALEVVNSSVVAERVVDMIGAAEITQPYRPERASEEERDKMGLVDRLTDWMHILQASWFTREPASVHSDVAVERFRRNFAAWADERASLIKMVYRAGSRAQAQRVLEEVVQVAIDRFGEVFAPPESRQWVLQMVESAEKEYTAAQAAYDQFVDEHKRVNFREEITASERQKATTEALLDSRRGARDANKATLATYRERLAKTPELRERTRKITENLSGARVELIKERAELISKRIELEGKSGSYETDKKINREQLAENARQLAELDQPREVTVVDDNPDYILLEARIREAQLEETELNSEVPRLEEELKRQADNLSALHARQAEADRIVEVLTRAKGEYERRRTAKESYEFQAQLDALGLTSLQRVENPTLPLLKEGPQRGRIILAGMAGGLLLSLTVLMLMVRMSKTFLRTSEVAVCLGRGDVVGMPWLDGGNVRRFRLARKRGWD